MTTPPNLIIRVHFLLALLSSGIAHAAELHVDCASVIGNIRPLHGVNCGPVADQELTDVSAYYKELAIPYTRLHDCHWPNPDVVDIHTIFPDSGADPEAAESYRFSRTDDYVKSILATGSQVVFRLGESIEHSRKKHYVNPPPDAAKWAAICVGIIRHYNEGWANGFRHGIRYWEIWNEPENRPAMWTGTDEDYLRLYTVAAKAIKAKFPNVLVGGPSFGYCGEVVGTTLKPTPFASAFLARCKEQSAPLDFFSWHRYTADPYTFHQQAVAVRSFLDANGFTKAESHLNEWNYLPNNDWKALSQAGQGLLRQKFYEEMRGPAGAAFTACALLFLQDSPVDVANYYRGDSGGFGLFTCDGVAGKPVYAFRAFKWLLDTPVRVATRGSVPGQLAIGAGMNAARTQATILISNYKSADEKADLTVEQVPWDGPTVCEAYALDAENDLARVTREERAAGSLRLPLRVKAPSVLLVRLMRP